MIKHYVLTLFLEIILPGQSAISKIGQQKSNRYYSIATLLLLRNYSFFQKICKYCLNAFVNFFFQKVLQIDN